MEKLVSLGKVLSDINRVRIIALLKREKELCVCELCDTLELSQPLVSRHLKQMREADIVSMRKSGKWMIYTLKSNETLSSLLIDIDFSSLPKLISCSTKINILD
jgi:ArsR family transcriptional regulator